MTLEERISALEEQVAALMETPSSYATSKYSVEEMDAPLYIRFGVIADDTPSQSFSILITPFKSVLTVAPIANSICAKLSLDVPIGSQPYKAMSQRFVFTE